MSIVNPLCLWLAKLMNSYLLSSRKLLRVTLPFEVSISPDILHIFTEIAIRCPGFCSLRWYLVSLWSVWGGNWEIFTNQVGPLQ